MQTCKFIPGKSTESLSNFCDGSLAALVQKFLTQPGVPVETATRVYRRYLQFEPSHAEEYITYLKAKVCPTFSFGVHTGSVERKGA